MLREVTLGCVNTPRASLRPSQKHGFAIEVMYCIMKDGWGGRIRTSACRYQKPVPYRLATPQCACD